MNYILLRVFRANCVYVRFVSIKAKTILGYKYGFRMCWNKPIILLYKRLYNLYLIFKCFLLTVAASMRLRKKLPILYEPLKQN